MFSSVPPPHSKNPSLCRTPGAPLLTISTVSCLRFFLCACVCVFFKMRVPGAAAHGDRPGEAGEGIRPGSRHHSPVRCLQGGAFTGCPPARIVHAVVMLAHVLLCCFTVECVVQMSGPLSLPFPSIRCGQGTGPGYKFSCCCHVHEQS